METLIDLLVVQPYPIGFFDGQDLLAEVRNRVANTQKSVLFPVLAIGWGFIVGIAPAVFEITENSCSPIPFSKQHKRHDEQADED